MSPRKSTAITEYDEQLVRRLIEKVTVYEDKFTVEFKSGVTVDMGKLLNTSLPVILDGTK